MLNWDIIYISIKQNMTLPPHFRIPPQNHWYVQWGKKVFSQPPIVQVLPLKKMREAMYVCHCFLFDWLYSGNQWLVSTV